MIIKMIDMYEVRGYNADIAGFVKVLGSNVCCREVIMALVFEWQSYPPEKLLVERFLVSLQTFRLLQCHKEYKSR